MRKNETLGEIELERWDDHEDIITDSLWLLGKRDSTGMHTAEYWGNFVPQIPYQAMRRFTKPGELVIDPFVGFGTTLIEAIRLGRYAIGVDLQLYCVEQARWRVHLETGKDGVLATAIWGDSTSPSTVETVREIMGEWGFTHAHLLILHPPYHDIIRFSEDPRDLSNALTTEEFLQLFGRVLDNFAPLLAAGRFLVLVIGDKYTRGEWIPLGFQTMDVVRQKGFRLKSICVKDIQENRGKRGQYHLWRYRALKHNFYIFKHEYVMFFEKVG
ncbi:MAG: site-specific DNA-methyltransferase [Armatimonadetes bacterium]|nr:site-specific DNA-methyltransferase [Armatimonadota bacterium]CUU34797.1 DNA methylase [Armatimonadetes bacterium DC]